MQASTSAAEDSDKEAKRGTSARSIHKEREEVRGEALVKAVMNMRIQ
jgi:hypothetical protein